MLIGRFIVSLNKSSKAPPWFSFKFNIVLGGLEISRGRSADQSCDEIQVCDIGIHRKHGPCCPRVNIFRITCKLGFNLIMITCSETNGTLWMNCRLPIGMWHWFLLLLAGLLVMKNKFSSELRSVNRTNTIFEPLGADCTESSARTEY